MFSRYLLTGATGFLGNRIAWMLHEQGDFCFCLVMENDPYIKYLPPTVKLVYGDVTNVDSLRRFFANSNDDTCLIHCAGIISIASKYDPRLYEVNVEGTKNVLYEAKRFNIKRTIYVSSVHAIPDVKKPLAISEIDEFDENLVKGNYAKSKAIATKIALEYAKGGLNLSVVQPSGIIGPNDFRFGAITQTINAYCKGKLRVASRGGNNFVDVRDVARGILNCAEKGVSGECYLLTGHSTSIKNILDIVKKYISGRKVIYLPLWIAKTIAPIYEKLTRKRKNLTLTPYTAYVLSLNSNYSYEKAKLTFNYFPRSLERTIKETVEWLLTTYHR